MSPVFLKIGRVVGVLVVTGLVTTIVVRTTSLARQTASLAIDFPVAQATSSTLVQVGVARPSETRDRLFLVRLEDGEVQEVVVEQGWRVTSLQHASSSAVLSVERGAAMLRGKEWNVPLRTPAGDAYEHVRIVQPFDARRLAILAEGSNGPVMISASRMGEVRELFPLPPGAQVMRQQEGDVWIVMTEGERMLEVLNGPSRLVRLNASGATSTIATDSEVITEVVAGTSDQIAYRVESGTMTARSGVTRWSGMGRPLLWIDAQTLLFSQKRVLQMLDLQKGELRRLGELSGDPTVASRK